MKGFMYILKCSDDTYYCSRTIDLKRRIKQHEVGEGANHTKNRLPVKLIYYEIHPHIALAFSREKQVQRWRREKKEALIKGEQHLLPKLAIAYWAL
ncbi:GIY-YIG nuclease family protein [Sandaracinomonas limnophila]|uniref:GIY-YIG nuclease family protein n=1 Tax=Sandaracinomonas limnophila TaxID=1862386 RepID=A0A437PS32_9BACT|nr:GIY-YIG nuclease family protein [Sandaracinomonas limnophila]RVU25056.1 GIY-YIG nuclease family protein [Sandaracinomonas limnophila]